MSATYALRPDRTLVITARGELASEDIANLRSEWRDDPRLGAVRDTLVDCRAITAWRVSPAILQALRQRARRGAASAERGFARCDVVAALPDHWRQQMLSTVQAASAVAVVVLTFTLAACDDDGSTQPPAPLTIASITPAASATSVSIDQPIQISFSSAVDPSSVSSTSVVVSRNATPVAGSLAVQGSTVTFTPAASYTEFRSQYAVSVTTAVRSTAGGALNTAFNSTFTTVMFDSLYYYQVINAAMGPTKALGTFAGGLQCFFADVGTGTGQQWYVTEIPASTFLLFRNRFQGAGHGLEGGTVGQPCLLTTLSTGGTNFTGQAWNVTAEGTGYRMTNQNLGASSSLGVVLVNNEQRPGMTATSAIASQSWSFARLIRR